MRNEMIPGLGVRGRQEGRLLHIELPPVEGSTVPREATFDRRDYTCDGEFAAEVQGYVKRTIN